MVVVPGSIISSLTKEVVEMKKDFLEFKKRNFKMQ